MSNKTVFNVSDKTLVIIRDALETGYDTIEEIAKKNGTRDWVVKKFKKAYGIQRPDDYKVVRDRLRHKKYRVSIISRNNLNKPNVKLERELFEGCSFSSMCFPSPLGKELA